MQYSNKGNLKPKLVVLLTGVNNFGHINETPSQVFDGIKAVIKTLRENYPKAKILINGVFPFEESANSPKRAQVKKVNSLVAKLDDHEHVFVKISVHYFATLRQHFKRNYG